MKVGVAARAGVLLGVVHALCGQAELADSGLTFELAPVAVIPDSSANLPPRISVVTEDPSGRLFANDQRGPLYLVDPATGTVSEYLDLQDEAGLSLRSTSEAGFQSFAFHPDFSKPEAPGFGRFYTFHSDNITSVPPDFEPNPGGTANFHEVVLEWRTDDIAATPYQPADPAKRYRVVLRIRQPYGNHNGGLIAFNPTALPGTPDDGALYLAVGDGGAGGDPLKNAQDTGNPLGAILRIDPLGADGVNGAYGIVADNALASDGIPTTLGEIYCYGLRNPQRFGWDRVTGAMYIADIGQSAWEEINLGGNGQNFGWDLEEGSARDHLHVDPVAEYGHETLTVFAAPPPGIGNRAVTVGEVVRGACVEGLEGKLLLADFPTGRAFQLDVESDPLDGGLDGLSEIRFREDGGPRVLLLDLINAARHARGLGHTSRADLRFSVNTPGRIFLSNKHDGILRRIVPDQQPGISINPELELDYRGVLVESDDLMEWRDVIPQPPPGEVLESSAPPRFLRSDRR